MKAKFLFIYPQLNLGSLTRIFVETLARFSPVLHFSTQPNNTIYIINKKLWW